MFASNTVFRVKRPDKARKSFSIQFNNGDKWQTFNSLELEAINGHFKKEVLSFDQANARVDDLLKRLYAERDALKAKTILLPGNVKIVEEFIKKTYTPQKILRLSDRSFESEKYALNRAIIDLGDTAIDGDSGKIQTVVDEKFKDDPGAHRKRVTAINRIRKWLKLDSILHLREAEADVLYISEKQLKVVLPLIKNS